MILEIVRADNNVDEYEISEFSTALSPTLAALVGVEDSQNCKYDDDMQNENNGGGKDNQDEEIRLRLPVTFEDHYMEILVQYFNFFAHNKLPALIKAPLNSAKPESLLHSRIYEWIQHLSPTELSRFRQIATFFQVQTLIDQIDGVLAIAILANPKDVLKEFHEPDLTLSSKQSVETRFVVFS